MRRVTKAGVAFIAVFAVAQLIRPELTNPATDATRTIQAHLGTASQLAAVLDRSCGDCHSNETVWRWYTQIAPMSWIMASGVAEGRKAVNFSEWASYTPSQQQDLLAASCQDASEGRMPGPYALLRPDTRLSAQDIETICAASRPVDSHGVGTVDRIDGGRHGDHNARHESPRLSLP